MRKLLEFILAGIVTVGSIYMAGSGFPLPENDWPIVAFFTLVIAIAILFFRTGSKAIGGGIFAGMGLIIVLFLFILYQASHLH